MGKRGGHFQSRDGPDVHPLQRRWRWTISLLYLMVPDRWSGVSQSIARQDARKMAFWETMGKATMGRYHGVLGGESIHTMCRSIRFRFYGIETYHLGWLLDLTM